MEAVFAQQLLDAMPEEWKGTTFRNSNLLGRAAFCEGLNELLGARSADKPVSEADLSALGMAEDYLRVASNVSTTLEALLARRKGCAANEMVTFASSTMPILAVALVNSGKTVHCYLGEMEQPLDAVAMDVARLLGCSIEFHAGAPQPSTDGGIVVRMADNVFSDYPKDDADAVVSPNCVHILSASKVPPLEMEVIRKRLATPLTSPVCLQWMTALAANAPVSPASWALPSADAQWPQDNAKALADFYAHLQEMTGAPVDANARPHCYTAGLPAICALWMALMRDGGAELLMCSTCYGGSSQLTDLLTNRSPSVLRKHNFHIQGDADIVTSLKKALEDLAALPAEVEGMRKRTTVLFVEVPTNPNMKVPDLDQLTTMIEAYVQAGAGVGRSYDDFLLLVDATFAPGSHVMEKMQQRLPQLPCMTFISMSKSVSRGTTTGGALVANGNARARELLAASGVIGAAMDTCFKLDQAQRCVDNHVGVEERGKRAHAVASQMGDALVAAVKGATGTDMPLAFVQPEHAAAGFTSTTFSFNLPRPEGANDDVTEAFAQTFVDALTENKQFKPCVSFGQDNGLVYCTVPATSTQGAIRPEDKALQAVGGVQLVRLSFPPSMDTDNAVAHITASVNKVYTK